MRVAWWPRHWEATERCFSPAPGWVAGPGISVDISEVFSILNNSTAVSMPRSLLTQHKATVMPAGCVRPLALPALSTQRAPTYWPRGAKLSALNTKAVVTEKV